MKEQELAKSVIVWLQNQHWDVYQEVQFSTYSGVADIAAVRNGLLWIIETKTTLTFKVLEQAHRWHSHLRSIAIPRAKNQNGRNFPIMLCERHLNLGVLTVQSRFADGLGVRETVSAPLLRENHKTARRLMDLLNEGHKTHAAAGSANGGHYTPYRATMDIVKKFIKAHPGCTLKQIMDDLDGGYHYATPASAKQSIRKALEFWEPWCRVERNDREYTYYLNAQEKNS